MHKPAEPSESWLNELKSIDPRSMELYNLRIGNENMLCAIALEMERQLSEHAEWTPTIASLGLAIGVYSQPELAATTAAVREKYEASKAN